jgi:hypothetical protein
MKDSNEYKTFITSNGKVFKKLESLGYTQEGKCHRCGQDMFYTRVSTECSGTWDHTCDYRILGG